MRNLQLCRYLNRQYDMIVNFRKGLTVTVRHGLEPPTWIMRSWKKDMHVNCMMCNSYKIVQWAHNELINMQIILMISYKSRRHSATNEESKARALQSILALKTSLHVVCQYVCVFFKFWFTDDFVAISQLWICKLLMSLCIDNDSIS